MRDGFPLLYCGGRRESGRLPLAQIIANKLDAPFLYVKRDQFGSEGRAGGDREGQEQPLLQYGIADIVY